MLLFSGPVSIKTISITTLKHWWKKSGEANQIIISESSTRTQDINYQERGSINHVSFRVLYFLWFSSITKTKVVIHLASKIMFAPGTASVRHTRLWLFGRWRAKGWRMMCEKVNHRSLIKSRFSCVGEVKINSNVSYLSLKGKQYQALVNSCEHWILTPSFINSCSRNDTGHEMKLSCSYSCLKSENYFSTHCSQTLKKLTREIMQARIDQTRLLQWKTICQP